MRLKGHPYNERIDTYCGSWERIFLLLKQTAEVVTTAVIIAIAQAIATYNEVMFAKFAGSNRIVSFRAGGKTPK